MNDERASIEGSVGRLGGSSLSGALGLAAFLLLIVTGFYLEQFYQPTQSGARESVMYVVMNAPLGDWVRSVHHWAAEALAFLLAAHTVQAVWNRSYRRRRMAIWWAGVALAGIVLLLLVTGSVLRADQEGVEALAHLTAGGKLLAPFGGLFLTDGFTPSTTMLVRSFALHTSLLPLVAVALIAVHVGWVHRIGIDVAGGDDAPFRVTRRAYAIALISYACLGLLAVLAPEGIGYPGVPGAEVTKPMSPLLWIYGVENLLGTPGMVIGPIALGVYLAALPLVDRSRDDRPGAHGVGGWLGVGFALAILGFTVYGLLGAARPHLTM